MVPAENGSLPSRNEGEEQPRLVSYLRVAYSVLSVACP